MGKPNGCVNETCETFKKKVRFKAGDAYCPKCGSPLFHVCKRCHMVLADPKKKLCIRCEAAAADKKKQVAKAGTGVLGTIGAAAVMILKKR